MTEIARLLSESNEARLIVGALAVALCLVVAMAWMLVAQNRRWGRFIGEAKGQDIEELLNRNLAEQRKTGSVLADLQSRTDVLESKINSSIRYIGAVKYDAFGEMGGRQSFALALYDEEGHGAVVTSQVGREACRVYCKELRNGQSDLPLSQEEGQAIEAAADSKSRARVVL